METTTALAIVASVITVAGMIIAAVLNYAKSLKTDQPWVKPLTDLRGELDEHRLSCNTKISDIDKRVEIFKLDNTKIDDVKHRILRMEDSINSETEKLERKIEDLMKLVINLLQGKTHG